MDSRTVWQAGAADRDQERARPTAVILGYDDYQRLVDLEDHYESALLTRSLKDDRFLTLDDVTKRLGL